MNWLYSKLGARDINKVNSKDYQDGKIYYNDNHIGWHNNNSRVIKAIIFSRNPLHKKDRIFTARIGRIKIVIYNYCMLSKLVEKHVTEHIIGIQLLNLRLIWHRWKGLSKQEKERIKAETQQWIASLSEEQK